MAYYDGLTGLYNRNYFVRLLTEFLRRAKEVKGLQFPKTHNNF